MSSGAPVGLTKRGTACIRELEIPIIGLGFADLKVSRQLCSSGAPNDPFAGT